MYPINIISLYWLLNKNLCTGIYFYCIRVDLQLRTGMANLTKYAIFCLTPFKFVRNCSKNDPPPKKKTGTPCSGTNHSSLPACALLLFVCMFHGSLTCPTIGNISRDFKKEVLKEMGDCWEGERKAKSNPGSGLVCPSSFDLACLMKVLCTHLDASSRSDRGFCNLSKLSLL